MIYVKNKHVSLVDDGGHLLRTLSIGVYRIFQTMMGIHLESDDMPERMEMTGMAAEAIDLSVRTWRALPDGDNLSCIFSGISGTGKTRSCFNIAHQLNLPVILCRGEKPDAILTVLRHLDGPVMLLFDEIEKMYKEDDSAHLLTLLDGTRTPVKVMYCLTMNDRGNLSKFIFNRPGRARYDFKFNAVTVEEALVFIAKKITLSAEDTEKVSTYLQRINDLSWDTVSKIVESLNLVGVDALKYLNVTLGTKKVYLDMTYTQLGKTYESYETVDILRRSFEPTNIANFNGRQVGLYCRGGMDNGSIELLRKEPRSAIQVFVKGSNLDWFHLIELDEPIFEFQEDGCPLSAKHPLKGKEQEFRELLSSLQMRFEVREVLMGDVSQTYYHHAF